MRDREEEKRRGPFPPVTSEQLLAAADQLATVYPHIKAVYLFGSRAHRRVRPSSDVDLAVWMDPLPEDRIIMESEAADLAESIVLVPTDVVILRPELSLPLLFEMFSMETILFAQDYEEAHNMACRCRAAYRDEKPRLDRQFKRVQQGIEELARACNPA